MKTLSILSLSMLLCLTACKTDKSSNGSGQTNSGTEVGGTVGNESEAAVVKIRSVEKKSGLAKTENWTIADSLVADAIAAHGGELYDTAHYGFRFRKKQYSFQNSPSGYRYTAAGQKEGSAIEDVLENGSLTRNVNGVETELSDKDVAKYTEALNSVIYFATLPHKLTDPSVNRDYLGRMTIKGEDYEVIGVTFEQEGGGTDYSDEFRYWINADTKTVDYLAYEYETNDGGVRFRSAYNPRKVGGIRFQDYVNYEAPIGTPLDELPKLYETGKLKELSRIETEKIVELKD